MHIHRLNVNHTGSWVEKFYRNRKRLLKLKLVAKKSCLDGDISDNVSLGRIEIGKQIHRFRTGDLSVGLDCDTTGLKGGVAIKSDLLAGE